MRRAVVAGILASTLALGTGLSASAQGGHGGVHASDGRVTVDLLDASLAAALREIGKQTGLAIVVLGSRDETVTMSFQAQPLERALELLTRGYGGGALLYEADGSRLIGAYITLGAGGAGLAAAAPAGSAATGTPPPPMTAAKANELVRAAAIEDFLPAARALHPDKTPVEAVYAVATGHPDPSARLNALGVVGEVGSGDRAKQVLEQASRDRDPSVSQLAKRLLGQTVDPTPVRRSGRR
jgi:hypothetical protein